MFKRSHSIRLIITWLILFRSISLCATTVNQNDKWKLLLSNTSTASLNGIVAIGTRNVVAVGAYATVKYSTDGGAVWKTTIADESGVQLNQAAKNLQNVIMAVGNNGTLISSIDSGKTWQRQSLKSKSNLYCICFKDSTGILAGENGAVFVSRDNGINWTDISLTDPLDVLSTCFRQDRSIAISCSDGSVYTNSSLTAKWEKHVVHAGLRLNSICSYSNILVTSGAGYGFMSTSSGENWVQQYYSKDVYVFYDMLFRSGKLFAAAGLSDLTYPHMYSNDSGKTWNIARHAQYFESRSMCLESNNLWLAGQSGDIGLIPDSASLVDTVIASQGRFGYAYLKSFSTKFTDYKSVASALGSLFVLSSDGIVVSNDETHWSSVLFVPYNADSAGPKVTPTEIDVNDEGQLVVLATAQKSGGSKPTFRSSVSLYDRIAQTWMHTLINDTFQLAKLRMSKQFGVVRAKSNYANGMYLTKNGGLDWHFMSLDSLPSDLNVNSKGKVVLLYNASPFDYVVSLHIDPPDWTYIHSSIQGANSVTLFDNGDHVVLSRSRQGSSYINKLSVSAGDTPSYQEYQVTTGLDSSICFMSTSKDQAGTALAPGRLFESQNSGKTWFQHEMEFRCPNVNSLRCSIRKVGELYVTTSEAVWKLSFERDSLSDVAVSNESASVYPRPASDVVHIVTDNHHLGANFTVSDILGRVRLEGVFSTESQVLDLSSLESGVYYLQYGPGLKVSADIIVVRR